MRPVPGQPEQKNRNKGATLSMAWSFFLYDKSKSESTFANGSRPYRKITDELSEETKQVIELQSNVIKLQSKVIEKRDQEFISPTSAVEKSGSGRNENVFISSVKTCAAASAPKKIHADSV